MFWQLSKHRQSLAAIELPSPRDTELLFEYLRGLVAMGQTKGLSAKREESESDLIGLLDVYLFEEGVRSPDISHPSPKR